MATEVSSPCVDYGPTAHTNPNIFQLEIKPKHVLCHEIGAGSMCTRCGKCPGLDLHFWRKLCKTCGCRMDEHDVILPNQYDHGQLIIGRLFGVREQFESVVADSYEHAKAQAEADRQANEGRMTAFGVMLKPVKRDGGGSRGVSPSRSGSDCGTDGRDRASSTSSTSSRAPLSQKSELSTAVTSSPRVSTATLSESKRTVPSAVYNYKMETNNKENEKVITYYSWVPISDDRLIDKYMNALPEEERPIAGTKGEQTRRQRLAYQLPLYDCNVDDSRFASDQDKVVLGKFVDNVKKHVIGVGKVVEVDSVEKNEKKRREMRETGSQTDLLSNAAQNAKTVNGNGGLDHALQLDTLADQVHQIGIQGSTKSQKSPISPGSQRATEIIQEIDPVPCKQCTDMINVGQVGIRTDHGIKEDTWHPGCFRCEQCQQLLVDMLYFYHQGKYYCGRHFADQLYPRCSGCDELIFANEYTWAEEKSWHFDHFACFKCDFKLGGHRYMTREEQPYCLDCFVKHFAKTCASCEEKIGPDEKRLNYEETHWHATVECFHCKECDESLIGKKFIWKENCLFCSSKCRSDHCAKKK
ncbi:unnamed protein product, partial [Mesorhabditis belari]|uniref:Testin n=1 Tax=Mesorhabditis belari TaxID=2138241 RepID=A0AAF3FFI3_9BILA